MFKMEKIERRRRTEKKSDSKTLMIKNFDHCTIVKDVHFDHQ